MRRLPVLILFMMIVVLSNGSTVSWAVDFGEILKALTAPDSTAYTQTQTPTPVKHSAPHDEEWSNEPNWGPMIVFLFLIASVIGFYLYMRNLPSSKSKRKRKNWKRP